MTSRNFFVISGNVSQKPRQFSGKAAKTVVTVAVDKFWTDQKSGEKKKRTEFLTAYTFNAKIGGFLIDKVNIGRSNHHRRPHSRQQLRQGRREDLHAGPRNCSPRRASARADHVADDVAP